MSTTLPRHPAIARTLQAASLGLLAGIGVHAWRRHRRPETSMGAGVVGIRPAPRLTAGRLSATNPSSGPVAGAPVPAARASGTATLDASGPVHDPEAPAWVSPASAPSQPTVDEVRRRTARLGIDEAAARSEHESKIRHLDETARAPGLGVFDIAKSAVMAWIDDGCIQQGAAIAYYTIFAIAPLMLIVLAIAGLVFGDEAASGQIFEQIGGLVGEDAAKGIQGIIASSNQNAGHGIVGAVVSAVTALIGASAVFVGLKAAFDLVFHPRAKDTTASAVTAFMRARLMAIAIVLALGFLVVVTLILSTATAALGQWLGGFAPVLAPVMAIVDLVLSTATLTLAFWMLIRFLPDRAPRPSAVWTGAFVSAVLFAIGKHLIGLYLARGAVASAYGAAGSLIVVVVWVYYSTQILLLGAEVAKAIDDPAAGDPPASGDRAAPVPAGAVRQSALR